MELLGGTRITVRLGDLHHEVPGLAIEWVTVPSGARLDGRSIGEGRIRTTTGASVVAVMRNTVSHPGPGPEFVLQAGDIVLIIGGIEGVEQARRLIVG